MKHGICWLRAVALLKQLFLNLLDGIMNKCAHHAVCVANVNQSVDPFSEKAL